MKLTYELLHSAANNGCINKSQAELLGVPFPLVEGWLKASIGKEISADTWQQVLAFRGMKPKMRRRLLRESQQPKLL